MASPDGSPGQLAMTAASMDLEHMDLMDLGLDEGGATAGGGAGTDAFGGALTSGSPDGGAATDNFTATLMKLEHLDIEDEEGETGIGNTKPMRNRNKSIDVSKLDGFDDKEFFDVEDEEGVDAQEDSSLACLAAEVLDSMDKEDNNTNSSPGPLNSSSQYDESSPDYPKDKKRLTIDEGAAPIQNAN